ncbi:MAG: hypothetical protein ACYSX0_10810 [Planctomycetota bacterium]|jgi:uncharacterized repeat protein (TIGR01451 family)
MRSLVRCASLLIAIAGCASVPSETKGEDGLTWYARAVPTGRTSSSAILVERGGPGEVPVGQPYDYEIRITNLTDLLLDDVVVSEFAEEGFALNSSEPEPDPDAAGATHWTLGTLGPKEIRTIKVNATHSTTGETMNRCEVIFRSLVHAKTLVVQPMLTLAWEAETQGLVGDPTTIRLTVSNPGTGATQGVVIEATLPEGLSGPDGKPEVRIEVGTLAPGESKESNVAVSADRTGSFELKASATGAGELSAETEALSLGFFKPALSVKASGPAEWLLDLDLTYSIIVKNNGDGPARETKVTLPLPAGLEFKSASDDGSPIGNGVMWLLRTLEPGAERTLTVTLSGAQAGDVKTSVTAQAHAAGEVSAPLELKLIGMPALLLEVGDTQDPVAVGGESVYEITVKNTGSAAGTNISITCEMEKSMEYVATEGPTSATLSGKVIALGTVDSLDRGQAVTWRVRVKAVAAGDIRFKVSMNSDQLSRPVDESEATKFFE